MLASITSTFLFLSIASAEPATTTPPSNTPYNRVVKQKTKYPFKSRYGLTLAAGSTSGIGIGVRKHFKNRFGFQVAALPILGVEDGLLFAGGQGMYTFFRRRVVRLYGLLGAQVAYKYETNRVTQMLPARPHQPGVNAPQPGPSFVPGPTSTVITRDVTTSFGAGLGLELHFNKRFSWALELPITTYINHSRTGNNRRTEVSVLPIPNTAITLYY